MVCLVCGKQFKRLASIIQHYNQFHDVEDKISYYCSYYSYSIKELKNDYLVLEKGLRTISYERSIPYSALKALVKHIGIMRSMQESIRLQNNKNKNTFMLKYGVQNPFQIRSVIDIIQGKNKANKKTINANRVRSVIAKYGVDNVSKIPDVKEKLKKFALRDAHIISDRLKRAWGDAGKKVHYIAQIKDGVMSRYGVTNVFSLPHIQDKIEKTILDKYGTYNIASSDYKKQIMIKNGYWMDERDRSNFDNYKLKVYIETRKWYKNLMDGWMLFFGTCYYTGDALYTDRGRGAQPSIDHKISIIYGFKNNIPPEVIGGPKNLCVCSCSFNAKKNWMTEEELYKSKHAMLTLAGLFN